MQPERPAPSPRRRSVSRAVSVPRCGVSSPFKGHLSVKSNAFYIGQSSRLSDQYQIRDHMITHYNKIINAKAAVDCSVPTSLTKSIKYSDQQRRERMTREVTRLEKESLRRGSHSRPRSREFAEDAATPVKDGYDGYSPIIHQMSPSDYRPVCSPSTCFSPCPRPFWPSGGTGKTSQMSSRLRSSTRCLSASAKFQDNQTKTYSGDLIEKHSRNFTETRHPFTPRTLKTQAKSIIAQYRYYTPPRRKRREAEAETNSSSFQAQEDEALARSEDGSPEIEPQSVTPTERTHQPSSSDDELEYLQFVVAVTNEILTLGLFSDRVLDRVFERHVEENRHRLDERKMRHLLDILKADLDSKAPKSFLGSHSSTSEYLRSPNAPLGFVGHEGSPSPLDVLLNGQHVGDNFLRYREEKDSEEDGLDDYRLTEDSVEYRICHSSNGRPTTGQPNNLLREDSEEDLVSNSSNRSIVPFNTPIGSPKASSIKSLHRKESDQSLTGLTSNRSIDLADSPIGTPKTGPLRSIHRKYSDQDSSNRSIDLADSPIGSLKTASLRNLHQKDSDQDLIGNSSNRSNVPSNTPIGSPKASSMTSLHRKESDQNLTGLTSNRSIDLADSPIGSPKTGPLMNLHQKDSDQDQIGHPSNRSIDLADSPIGSPKAGSSKKLEDLAESFSEMVNVSKTEDYSDFETGSDPEEDRSDPCDEPEGETNETTFNDF